MQVETQVETQVEIQTDVKTEAPPGQCLFLCKSFWGSQCGDMISGICKCILLLLLSFIFLGGPYTMWFLILFYYTDAEVGVIIIASFLLLLGTLLVIFIVIPIILMSFYGMGCYIIEATRDTRKKLSEDLRKYHEMMELGIVDTEQPIDGPQ